MFKPLGGGRGILSLNGREISTPNFIAPTIRGAIPHLTPDNYPTVPIGGVYAEHFVDQHGFSTDAARILPVNSEVNLIAIRPPNSKLLQRPNTDDGVGIGTFQGTQLVNVETISKAISDMSSSIVVSPLDLPNKAGVPGKNRLRKMEKRGETWFKRLRANLPKEALVVASIIPEMSPQEYLKEADGVSVSSSSTQPRDQPLEGLRICDERVSLKDIPSLIGQFDLFYTEFDVFTEKGHAMTGVDSSIDLHDSQYAEDMGLLGETGCAKAYVHHLLNAREMTANVILQQHNLAFVAKFFETL